jgi:hypothetical protein
VLRLALPHVFFSIVSLTVSVLGLADIQEQLTPTPTASPVALQAANQTANPLTSHPVMLLPLLISQPINPILLQESFVYIGKEGGEGTDLKEGHGIVTRETSNPSV